MFGVRWRVCAGERGLGLRNLRGCPVIRMPCWVATVFGLDGCQFRPDGQPDMAHVAFRENWLLKAPLGPHLTKEQANDPRILRPVCRLHHGQLDNYRLALRRHQLPESVEDYAREFNLLDRLDYLYPPADEGDHGDMERDRPGNPAVGDGGFA